MIGFEEVTGTSLWRHLVVLLDVDRLLRLDLVLLTTTNSVIKQSKLVTKVKTFI